MSDLDAIYAKTAAGLDEGRHRALARTRTQRMLPLILVDGKRRLSALIAALGAAGEDPLAAADALLRFRLVEAAAKLTIDEKRAAEFLAAARRLIC